MPKNILLHPITAAAVHQLIASPPHAMLVVGPTGSGKLTIARYIAAGLLNLELAALEAYPYIRIISPVDGKAITIESIRELQALMTLKVPTRGETARGTQATQVARIVIIEQAHLMTTEAQNALLKTLEEPPLDTVLILTATSPEAMLATVQSRVRVLMVTAPALTDAKNYFVEQGLTAEAVDQVTLMSGGLPGLTHAMLSAPDDHPLRAATVQARQLLQASAYERLALVDGLSKQKQLCLDTLFILMQMARMTLMRSSGTSGAGMSAKSRERWQSILSSSYRAEQALRGNTQAKLVLTDLMLNL